MNTIVLETRDVLLNSAKQTFGVRRNRNVVKNNPDKNQTKDWFDKDRYRKRKDFRKARRLNKHYASNIFKSRLKASEKIYKKTLDNSMRYKSLN